MDNQSGAIKFKTMMILLIVAGLVYVAAKLGPPYVQDYRIQKLVERAASNMGRADRRPTFRAYLVGQIKYMDLPFEADDFIVERDGNDVWVTLEWERTVVWIPPNRLVPAQYQTIYFLNEGVAEYRE